MFGLPARAIVLSLFLGILFTPHVLAVSLSFSNQPTSVNQEEEFEIDVSLDCSGCKNSYLRAVFFSPGTTKYFGYTQNNAGDWINTTADKSLYFHVSSGDVVDGSWSGRLKVKTDPDSSGFSGAGEYEFKVGRYTSAGSSATWSSDVVTISIITPIPTFTPIPTPTPISIATPTNTPTPTSATTSSTNLTASFPPSVKQGNSFTVNTTLDHASPDTAYYLKVRFGPSSSSLNHGQTLCGTDWLSDTASYSKFTSYTTDGSGHLSVSLTARVSPDKATESTLQAKVRAEPVDRSAHIDSTTGSISVEIVPTAVPTTKSSATATTKPSQTSTPTPKTSGSPTPSIDPTSTQSATTSDVLGAITTASSLTASTGGDASLSASPTGAFFSRFTLGKVIGLTGMTLLFGALLYLSYQEGWYKL